MKAIPSLAFVAATLAFLVLPLKLEVATAILTAAAMLAILVADYSRRSRPIRVRAAEPALLAQRKERFGLAA